MSISSGRLWFWLVHSDSKLVWKCVWVKTKEEGRWVSVWITIQSFCNRWRSEEGAQRAAGRQSLPLPVTPAGGDMSYMIWSSRSAAFFHSDFPLEPPANVSSLPAHFNISLSSSHIATPSHTHWGIFPGDFSTFNLHSVVLNKITKAAAVHQWLRAEWSYCSALWEAWGDWSTVRLNGQQLLRNVTFNLLETVGNDWRLFLDFGFHFISLLVWRCFPHFTGVINLSWCKRILQANFLKFW